MPTRSLVVAIQVSRHDNNHKNLPGAVAIFTAPFKIKRHYLFEMKIILSVKWDELKQTKQNGIDVCISTSILELDLSCLQTIHYVIHVYIKQSPLNIMRKCKLNYGHEAAWHKINK